MMFSRVVSQTIEPVVTSDESLVVRLRNGETEAGEQLVRRHCQSLMRYLSRLSGDEQLAEELHQQTWLSVLDHIDRFDVRSSAGGFKAWLFRIATNKANDHWRGLGRDRLARQSMAPLAAEREAPPADAGLAGDEDQAQLRRAIERLPEAQRQVLLMRYYGNLKFVEIAQVLGCPLNTALGRMHKAMSKLKALMKAD